MTLVITVNGPETIWLLADRRLSRKGRKPQDDARKVMFLETIDGVAILGYAGLGATAFGTEPSDWMSNVLRGRNLPLEHSLDVIAEAMTRQLPKHMIQKSGSDIPTHDVVITALLKDRVRLYTICLLPKSHKIRRTRLVVRNTERTPRICLAGSGGNYLVPKKKWRRRLLGIVKRSDKGQVSQHTVADHLASLNLEVSKGISDKSVGPHCIVAWRNKKGGIHKIRGSHQSYTKAIRDNGSTSIPTIGMGNDLEAFFGVLEPRMAKVLLESLQTCEPPELLDKDEINAELARLPDKPDEYLR